MSQPIHLSDSELTAIMDADCPLQVCDRDAFLRAVAEAIVKLPEPGPGAIHRVITHVQRQYFDRPLLERASGSSKYR